MIVILWFRFLERAKRCVLEQNTSFHVAPFNQLVKMSDPAADRHPVHMELIRNETEILALMTRDGNPYLYPSKNIVAFYVLLCV